MLLDMIETNGKVSINMLQVVNILSKTWQEITAATIQHSSRHAGICSSQDTNPFDSEDNLPLSDWVNQQIVDLESKSQETLDNQDEEDGQVVKAE
ncbi:hypothetical protein KGM_203098 [Danaus plexippus plexippus]|uniref:DDE-1 domain-containing protein n=1 Tax=Danaus plexippus plexippus TaxID=278856 RepID=A0A212F4T1_DANPL|nr:hypothetical protein KGM_203098 [Danaus plexippus plexippus]